MNTKSFALGLIVIILVFILAVGGIAIYASALSDQSYDKKDSSYEPQIVINKYENQQPQQVQPTPGTNCNQQVTSYVNGQPVVECDGSSSTLLQQNQAVTKINIQVSGGYSGYGYYPYYKYKYYPYYKPHYSPYPYYNKKFNKPWKYGYGW